MTTGQIETTARESQSKFFFLGDHPALDFLNTVPLVDGVLVDSLASDSDVAEWLRLSGWPVESDANAGKASALLAAARELRSVIRTLVERHAAGKRLDPEPLNVFLAEARNYPRLTQKKDGSLQLRLRWKQRTAHEILAPLAQSAAELLAEGDFSLVRRCESEQCVLWFYDRTKSHQRRWCSMANCGNRHKVAAYRQRKQQGL
jgi:predicted RNA-binding Zn ribbon-like protein